MTLHVYENWTIRRAVIHQSDCGHCNNGQGKHAGASNRNGRWLGPFATYEAATEVAEQTGQPMRNCGHCGAGRAAAPRPLTTGRPHHGQTPGGRSRRLTTRTRERVESLVRDLEHHLSVFDEARPFSAEAWSLHKEAIDKNRRAPGVAGLVADDEFLRLLYRTLEAWGMNSRGAELLAEGEFVSRIRAQTSALAQLEGLSIGAMTDPDAKEATSMVWQVMSAIRASAKESFLVAASKTLHHLVPELVPPMDRRYTYRFFAYPIALAPIRQEGAFREMFGYFHKIAVERRDAIAPYLGRGMHTSVPKTIDNAIIGYGIEHGS